MTDATPSIVPDSTDIAALYLAALYEPILHNDRPLIECILSTLEGNDPRVDAHLLGKLRRYVEDSIGVRKWALNERVFFTTSAETPAFPVVAPRAMMRLREARVAAAYGLRIPAVALLRKHVQLPAHRLNQVCHALAVYEAGIQKAFSPEVPEAPEVPETAPELASDPVPDTAVSEGAASDSLDVSGFAGKASSISVTDTATTASAVVSGRSRARAKAKPARPAPLASRGAQKAKASKATTKAKASTKVADKVAAKAKVAATKSPTRRPKDKTESAAT